MKTALIFTYYWPPASGPGVQRWLKFVKYLPQFGWKPVVVTPESGSYPNVDETLIDDIPSDIEVIKTKTMEPFRWYNWLTGQGSKGKTSSVGMSEVKDAKSPIKKLAAYIRANWFIPDARVGWVPYALSAAEKYLKVNKVDMLITTGPPHSTHLIGQRLKKKTGLPWIADLRDPWTNIYYNAYLPRTEKTRKKDKELEDEVVTTADGVLVISKGLKEEFHDRTQSIKVIYNGFDVDDFNDEAVKSNSKNFILSYIGNFKANQNIAILWQALREVIDERKEFASKFILEFTGNIHKDVLKGISESGLNSYLEVNSFVKHAEAINLMKSASVLLFIVPYTENNERILTGKLFEYLASDTPIFSIGPKEGEAEEILTTSGNPEMCDYQAKDKMKKTILSLFDQWKEDNGKLQGGRTVDKFSRKNQTERLVSFMNKILAI